MATIKHYKSYESPLIIENINSCKLNDILFNVDSNNIFRVIEDNRGGLCLEKVIDANICNNCKKIIFDIDAGFSPAIQKMKCGCGGDWIRPL